MTEPIKSKGYLSVGDFRTKAAQVPVEKLSEKIKDDRKIYADEIKKYFEDNEIEDLVKLLFEFETSGATKLEKAKLYKFVVDNIPLEEVDGEDSFNQVLEAKIKEKDDKSAKKNYEELKNSLLRHGLKKKINDSEKKENAVSVMLEKNREFILKRLKKEANAERQGKTDKDQGRGLILGIMRRSMQSALWDPKNRNNLVIERQVNDTPYLESSRIVVKSIRLTPLGKEKGYAVNFSYYGTNHKIVNIICKGKDLEAIIQNAKKQGVEISEKFKAILADEIKNSDKISNKKYIPIQAPLSLDVELSKRWIFKVRGIPANYSSSYDIDNYSVGGIYNFEFGRDLKGRVSAMFEDSTSLVNRWLIQNGKKRENAFLFPSTLQSLIIGDYGFVNSAMKGIIIGGNIEQDSENYGLFANFYGSLVADKSWDKDEILLGIGLGGGIQIGSKNGLFFTLGGKFGGLTGQDETAGIKRTEDYVYYGGSAQLNYKDIVGIYGEYTNLRQYIGGLRGMPSTATDGKATNYSLEFNLYGKGIFKGWKTNWLTNILKRTQFTAFYEKLSIDREARVPMYPQNTVFATNLDKYNPLYFGTSVSDNGIESILLNNRVQPVKYYTDNGTQKQEAGYNEVYGSIEMGSSDILVTNGKVTYEGKDYFVTGEGVKLPGFDEPFIVNNPRLADGTSLVKQAKVDPNDAGSIDRTYYRTDVTTDPAKPIITPVPDTVLYGKITESDGTIYSVVKGQVLKDGAVIGNLANGFTTINGETYHLENPHMVNIQDKEMCGKLNMKLSDGTVISGTVVNGEATFTYNDEEYVYTVSEGKVDISGWGTFYVEEPYKVDADGNLISNEVVESAEYWPVTEKETSQGTRRTEADGWRRGVRLVFGTGTPVYVWFEGGKHYLKTSLMHDYLRGRENLKNTIELNENYFRGGVFLKIDFYPYNYKR